MYKRDDHYYSVISTEDLYKELDTNYKGETDLVQSLMSRAISNGWVQTRHELGVANEELWSLNDWPEGEGYGSSDRGFDLRAINRAVDHNRKFLKAEAELIAINKLTDFPKVDDTLNYMAMNRTIQQYLKKEVA